MDLCEKLREEDIRPLIKHQESRPIDHMHNAKGNGSQYYQRAMCETVFLTIKRTFGDSMRARTLYDEFENSSRSVFITSSNFWNRGIKLCLAIHHCPVERNLQSKVVSTISAEE